MIELLLEAERALGGGQLDRAGQLYEQVAEADPRNAIAIVGLARVALARGDDLGAYLLARRALTIDPEDDAARRLAVRLEAALATRGAPVADPLPAGSGDAKAASDAAAVASAAVAAIGDPDPAPTAAGAFVPSTADPATGAAPAAKPAATSRRSRLGRFLRLGR